MKIELVHNVFEKTNLNDLELLEIEIEKNLLQNNEPLDIEQSEDVNNEQKEVENFKKLFNRISDTQNIFSFEDFEDFFYMKMI